MVRSLRVLGFLIVSFASAGLVHAQKKAVFYELIQSTPVETTMPSHGLRDTKPVWLEMINNATRSIDLSQFYMSNVAGEPLEPIIQALQDAATKRGVKVRYIISDALMDKDIPTYERLKATPNIEVRIYNIRKRTGGIVHTKYWIVDGEKVFLGSQNTDWRALKHIHELGVLTNEPQIVSDLKKIYEVDWQIAQNENYELPKNPKIPECMPAPIEFGGVVASPPELLPHCVDWSLPKLLALINNAKQSIEIQLLSYSAKKNWHELNQALKNAAKRGVQIKMVVADWNIRGDDTATLKSLDATENLGVRIGHIPTHSSGEIPYARVVHCKYMTIDGKTLWMGTSNWSKGYFYSSRNVEIIMQRPELAAKTHEIFDWLWNSQYTLTIEQAEELKMKKEEAKKATVASG